MKKELKKKEAEKKKKVVNISAEATPGLTKNPKVNECVYPGCIGNVASFSKENLCWKHNEMFEFFEWTERRKAK